MRRRGSAKVAGAAGHIGARNVAADAVRGESESVPQRVARFAGTLAKRVARQLPLEWTQPASGVKRAFAVPSGVRSEGPMLSFFGRVYLEFGGSSATI